MNDILLADAVRLVTSSTSILLVLPPRPTLDMVAAAGVFQSVFQSEPRQVSVYSEAYTANETTNFLPIKASVLPELLHLREFIIRVGLQSASLESLRYETKNNELQLYLVPKRGYFESKDVHLSSGSFSYDLIVTIGVDRREMIGTALSQQPEFFAHTPILSLDTHAHHDQFGQLNIVDATATSLSEILVTMLPFFGGAQLNEDQATTLFAGMMSQTKGFQTTSITPKSLAAAASLLSLGARRDDVVRHLYHTKSLATLRVWGAALSRLTKDPATDIAYTTITKQDTVHAPSSFSSVAELLDELLSTAQESVIVLLIERPADIEVHIVVRDPQRKPQFPEGVEILDAQHLRALLTTPLSQAIETVMGWWKTPVRK